MSGKPRLILLRSGGELWPVSTHDVQFVMPASLVSPEIAKQCWSSSLIDSSQSGSTTVHNAEDASNPSAEDEAVLDARRKAVMILRRVSRETEKMCGRMMNGAVDTTRSGGIEAIYGRLAPNNRAEAGTATAALAAQYILNRDPNEPRVSVRPNTLPAYAAHVIMMRRPDLFLGDQGDMWATGQFLRTE